MKTIQHYFDWYGKDDITLCGRKLTKTCWIHWVTNKRKVTCKCCLKKMSKK